MTTSLSRAVDAFNDSQCDTDWATLSGITQCGVEREGVRIGIGIGEGEEEEGGEEERTAGAERGGGGEGHGEEEEGAIRAVGEGVTSVGEQGKGGVSRSSGENESSQRQQQHQQQLQQQHSSVSPILHPSEDPCSTHTQDPFFTVGVVMTDTLTLFERACSGGGEAGLFPPLPHTTPLPRKPDMAAFRLFCTVLLRAYESKKKERIRVIEEGRVVGGRGEGEGEGKGEGEGTEIAKTSSNVQERVEGMKINQTYMKRENSTDSTDNQPTPYSIAIQAQSLQDALQHALDELDMCGVADAVSRGAVVYPALLRQAAHYFGDEHFPLFSLLLTCGELYMAGR